MTLVCSLNHQDAHYYQAHIEAGVLAYLHVQYSSPRYNIKTILSYFNSKYLKANQNITKLNLDYPQI